MKPFVFFARFLLCINFIMLFINCSNANSNTATQKNVINLISAKYFLDTKSYSCDGNKSSNFWVRNLTSSSQNTYCVQSSLVASSANMDLFLQNGLTTNLDYTSVVNAFETNIFPIEKDALGSPSDVNQDGKVTVLILDIIDGSTTGSGFVAGFVDPVNFSEDNPSLTIRSNQREILFMDGVELLRLRDKDLAKGKPDTFLSTLAHEFHHLIRYQYAQGSDDTWIEEGTSEVTSDLTGYGPQSSRLNCFKGDAVSSSSCNGGIGSNSVGSPSLFNWSSSLKSYAYAYSFMKYVYESSGTDSTTRNNFFRKTVQGVNGTRANNAYNLMSIFLNSNTHNTSVLGLDNKTAFKKLFASFLGQAVGYSNLNTVYFGNTTAVNIDSVRNNYLFSSTLSLLSTPTPFSSISKPLFINLNPSQVSRITGTTTGVVSGSTDLVIVSNGNNEFIIFNGDNIGSKTNISSGTFYLSEKLHYPELDLQTGEEVICPNDLFVRINKIEQVKYALKPFIYKENNE